MTTPNPVVVGVAGGSGSGKTTVVRRLIENVAPDSVALIHHDSYYRDYADLPEEDRAAINFDHPESLETELLVEDLDHLVAGQTVEVPVYDFTTHTRKSETRTVRPARVIIVDGLMVLAEPELRERMDIKIFVDADADIRLIRRLRRDIRERGRSAESVLRQYEETVRPMHLEFVAPSKRWADIIIPEGGFNQVAIRMLVANVREILDRA